MGKETSRTWLERIGCLRSIVSIVKRAGERIVYPKKVSWGERLLEGRIRACLGFGFGQCV
jgi:hypothetical protein